MPRNEPDHLVDAPTAAAYVAHLRGRPCAPGTIWSWATRGHIHRYGRGRYDIREIDTWTRRLIMNELIEWYRAQLDADEQVAQRVDPHQAPADLRAMVTREGSAPFLVVDSALVLADIAAKRRILDLPNRAVDHPSYRDDYDSAKALDDTIRLLALPYANRPGYQHAWRPA